MEHHEFSKIIQTLLPIAIFVLWALLSRPAQKRKKAQEALERKRRESEAARAEPMHQEPADNAHAEDTTAGENKWRGALDDMLSEMGLPVERRPSPLPVETPSEKKPELPEEAQTLEDLEPEVAPQKPVDKQMKAHLAIQERAYTLAASPIESQNAYSITTESFPAIGSESLQATSLSSYSADELQKFIVWSEVLGKPIGLRDFI
jgi:hypothetical protein